MQVSASSPLCSTSSHPNPTDEFVGAKQTEQDRFTSAHLKNAFVGVKQTEKDPKPVIWEGKSAYQDWSEGQILQNKLQELASNLDVLWAASEKLSESHNRKERQIKSKEQKQLKKIALEEAADPTYSPLEAITPKAPKKAPQTQSVNPNLLADVRFEDLHVSSF
jgi:hypothetical protein